MNVAAVAAAALCLPVLAAGCAGSPATRPAPAGGGSSPAPGGPASATGAAGSQTPVPAESNPPGDIPDNLSYVPYRSATGGYGFRHPEGWSQADQGNGVTFTDKLNGVVLTPGPATTPPSEASARQSDVPSLGASQAAFELRTVAAVTLPGGTGVRIVYRRNSAPDPVSGRQYRDEVERYEVVSGGHEVVMELFGPVGADNVDAYKTMVQSLRVG